MAKNNEIENPSINIIGGDTMFKGDITSNGDFRIDGTLIGSIVSKAKVIVGNTGSVEGTIKCQNADFSGNINANVTVSELLALKSTSKLVGNIVIGKISIEAGAQFNGKCSMETNQQNDNLIE